MKLRKTLHRVIAGLMVLGLAGLTQLAIAADAPKEAAAPTSGTAHIRVLQTMPTGPSINVELNEKSVAPELAVNSLSAYFDVPAGKCHFVFTGSKDQEKLWNSHRTVDPGVYYTAVLYTDEGKPALKLSDESSREITEGKARVYFYNYSADAGDLRITVASKRAKAGYTQWLKRVRQGGVSSKSAPTGSFTLQLRRGENVVKEIPDFTVEAGQRLTVFILGKAADLQVATTVVGSAKIASATEKAAPAKAD